MLPTEEEVLKVVLQYLEELHAEHNSYPHMAPEKKAMEAVWMSACQRRLMEEMGLEGQKGEKLVLTLQDKKNYLAH